MRHHFGVYSLSIFRVLGWTLCCAWAQSSAAHEPLNGQIFLLTKKIEADPRNAELILRRADLYHLEGKWDEALGDLDRAGKLNPKLAAVELLRGRTLLAKGIARGAKGALDRFLSAQPDHAAGLMNRARAHAKLDENSDALADYSRALAISPNPLPDDFIERARFTEGLGGGRIEDALAGLDEGIGKLGPIPALELHAIELEVKLKHYDQALGRLEKISSQGQRKDQWLVRRGEILLQAGRNAEARTAFQEALDEIGRLPAPRRKARATLDLESKIKNLLAESEDFSKKDPA
ncbi:tetratricopeptide repeat protein [Candidatus Sumerlaeota bacterium]|nr:tetratricopeptide repeat protein [Candidatus Sumerlaeota bacterium]